jgi:hypothetical protein
MSGQASCSDPGIYAGNTKPLSQSSCGNGQCQCLPWWAIGRGKEIFSFWWYWGLNSGPHGWSRQKFYYLSNAPKPCFALVICQIGSRVFAQAGLGHDPPNYASHEAGMTGVYHHTKLYWLRWGLTNFLPKLASNLNLPNYCLLSSWDYRHEPLYLAKKFFLQWKRVTVAQRGASKSIPVLEDSS